MNIFYKVNIRLDRAIDSELLLIDCVCNYNANSWMTFNPGYKTEREILQEILALFKITIE